MFRQPLSHSKDLAGSRDPHPPPPPDSLSNEAVNLRLI